MADNNTEEEKKEEKNSGKKKEPKIPFLGQILYNKDRISVFLVNQLHKIIKITQTFVYLEFFAIKFFFIF